MRLDLLQGKYVRLEPLDHSHTDGLVEAAHGNQALFQWTPVPQYLEGVIRAHKLSTDLIPRDSARYSIITEEWSDVKTNLISLLNSYN